MITVKIAVAVDPKGQWNSCGWSCDRQDADDGELMGLALESLDEGEARYWLTATLPVPEVVEVAASVEPAE